jgi:hypothetical protein
VPALSLVLRGAALGAAVLALAACGSASGADHSTAPTCSSALRAGWQRLANRIHAPVYCPTWMPQPLDGRIGAGDSGGPYVERNGAYLASFIYQDPNPSATYEVHVNLRGYPGRTSVPVCQDTVTAGSKILHPRIPCFADPHGHRQFGSDRVTIYTANQGADTWHVLYAWRHAGSLYAVSEHVVTPNTYQRVVANLDRIMRGLVLIRPGS